MLVCLFYKDGLNGRVSTIKHWLHDLKLHVLFSIPSILSNLIISPTHSYGEKVQAMYSTHTINYEEVNYSIYLA